MYVCMYVYIYMYVCRYVCMYVCVYLYAGINRFQSRTVRDVLLVNVYKTESVSGIGSCNPKDPCTQMVYTLAPKYQYILFGYMDLG